MSNADEILKLKELLDKNVITQEEFEQKKKELLNNNNVASNSKKFCQFCGKEIPKDAKICIYCGKQVEQSKITFTENKNKKSGCLPAFILLIVTIFFVNTFVKIPVKDNNKSNENLLMSEYSLSEKEVNDVIDILDKCGYSEYYPNYKLVKGADNDEIKGSIGFEIQQGEKIGGFVDIKDNKVCLVQYSDKILYKDGKVKHTLSEYLITMDEKGNLIRSTQEIIKNILKSPSTAKFPWDYSEWYVGKENGSTIVQGYVDSQNGFGAMIRSNFQVTYKNNTVTSLIFDGKEYIK